MTVHNAIILLAGRGTRLAPLTDTTHKALIEIVGKTILDRQISQLAKAGVKRFHLVLGHRAADIKAHLSQNYSGWDVVFYENPQFETTNTAFSLHLVLKELVDDFLLCDGDVVMADALIQTLCAAGGSEGLLLCETDPSKLDAEAVKAVTNAAGDITDIGKHIPLDRALGESIGIGFYPKEWGVALKSRLDQLLRDQSHWNWYYEDAIRQLLSEGATLPALRVLPTSPHPWVEVDDANDLKRAQSLTWE